MSERNNSSLLTSVNNNTSSLTSGYHHLRNFSPNNLSFSSSSSSNNNILINEEKGEENDFLEKTQKKSIKLFNNVFWWIFLTCIILLPFFTISSFTKLFKQFLMIIIFQFLFNFYLFYLYDKLNHFIEKNVIFVTKPKVMTIQTILNLIEEQIKEQEITSPIEIFSIYSIYCLLLFCQFISKITYKPFLSFELRESIHWENDVSVIAICFHFVTSCHFIYTCFTSNKAMIELIANREEIFKILFWFANMSHFTYLFIICIYSYFISDVNYLLRKWNFSVSLFSFVKKLFNNQEQQQRDDEKNDILTSFQTNNLNSLFNSSGNNNNIVKQQDYKYRFKLMEWQAFSYTLAFSLYSFILYFNYRVDSLGLLDYFIQLFICIVLIIHQMVFYQFLSLKRYFLFSLFIIILSLLSLNIFLLFLIVIIYLPIEKNLFEIFPMIINENTWLRRLAYYWIIGSLFIATSTVFIRGLLFVLMVV